MVSIIPRPWGPRVPGGSSSWTRNVDSAERASSRDPPGPGRGGHRSLRGGAEGDRVAKRSGAARASRRALSGTEARPFGSGGSPPGPDPHSPAPRRPPEGAAGRPRVAEAKRRRLFPPGLEPGTSRV